MQIPGVPPVQERVAALALTYGAGASVTKSFPNQPKISSHSFQVDYISKLWKDTKDLEFVRQIIRHQRIDTTSLYVEKLFDI